MPEPGAGSGGARGGSGMGAGDRGGYGRERDDSGRIADRIGYGVDLGGVEREGWYEGGREGGWINRSVRPGGLIETYLEDTVPSVEPVAPVTSPLLSKTVSSKITPYAGIKFAPATPAKPIGFVDPSDKPIRSGMGEWGVLGGHPGARVTPEDFYGLGDEPPESQTPDQPTSGPIAKLDIEAKKHAVRTNPKEVMAEALTKMGISSTTISKMSSELIAALTIGKKGSIASARIEPSALGKRAGASYQHANIDPLTGKPRPGTDQIRVGPRYTTGDVVHELGHRLAMEASRLGILDKISMPNVQALFETGGNPLSAGYGAQGEMVTSRAGTAQNLVDAMHLARQQDWGWENDYWDAVTGVHPTAAKAGWTTNTLSDFANEDEDSELMKASPYSVPGSKTAGWKEGYQDWMNWQQELPSVHYGGAYTDTNEGLALYGPWTPEQLNNMGAQRKGIPFGPAAVTGDYWSQGGLLNWPMKGHHGLIQEFMLRNKNLLSGQEDISQAKYNQMVALSRTNPAAKIRMIEEHNLPTEFWDKLDAYLSKNPSEYSPTGSAETVEKTVMSMDQ